MLQPELHIVLFVRCRELAETLGDLRRQRQRLCPRQLGFALNLRRLNLVHLQRTEAFGFKRFELQPAKHCRYQSEILPQAAAPGEHRGLLQHPLRLDGILAQQQHCPVAIPQPAQ